ncbi:MAG: hypothetical protein ABJA34_08975 [Pseudonocardiales bacterium]
MTARRRLLLAAAGAATTRALLAAGDRAPAGMRERLQRPNFRGRSVSLLAGPLLAVAASATACGGAPRSKLGRAAALAGLAAGALGSYDDLAPAHPGDKGFRGHLSAATEGRLSGGLAKLVGVGAAGLLAGRAVAAGPIDTLVTGGVIAGTANLVNLVDLRPGRALKAALLLGLPLLAGPAGDILAGPMGAAAAALPDDLAEHAMLGDAGANAIGAIVGLGLAASTGRAGRAGLLAVLLALTGASERISFTGVIERTRVLREIDALGRRRPLARA